MPNRSLVQTITFRSAALIFCAFVLTVAADFWDTYTQAEEAYNERLTQQLELLSQSLENPLWAFDEQTVSLIGDAYMSSEHFASLTITAQHSDAPIYQQKTPSEADILYGQKDITYQQKVIGQVRVGLSKTSHADNLFHHMRFSIILAAIIIVSLVIMIKGLLQRHLGNPLEILEEWSDNLASGKYGEPPPPIKLDELRSLAGKFENMSEQISRRELSLINSEKSYRALFENTEVSIWNEDLSEVVDILNGLRREGVADLRAYLERQPQTAWDLAARVKVRQVNEATLKLFGATSEDEMLGKIDSTFGTDTLEVFVDSLCAIWEKKKHFRSEANYRTLSGDPINAIISFAIPESEEGFRSIPVSISDITELKQAEQSMSDSEERFRLIFESNPDPVILAWLEDGAIIDVNQSFEEITGIRRQDAIGFNSEQLGVWEKPNMREDFRQQIEQYGELNNFEAHFRIKDGQPKICLLSARILSIGGRQVLLLVFRDVTTEKEAEKALIEMDRMKSEFISTTAHELRTPLSAMMGYAEFLLEPEEFGDFTEDQKSEFLNEIYDRGASLSRIIDDLLDISRIESGKTISLAMQATNISDVLKKTAAFFRTNSPGHSIRLELPGKEEDTTLWIDRHRIIQVLENLLSNAVKYSPRNTEITLKGYPTETGWDVQVIDQGIGMSPDQVEKVFDKFYRADSSDSAVSGLGLGMSIAQQIVDAHGGQLRVESQKGVGTTVTMSLVRNDD
jgi:PAS domain S-box-containing protein